MDGDTNVVEVILKRVADVNTKNNFGGTALALVSNSNRKKNT